MTNFISTHPNIVLIIGLIAFLVLLIWISYLTFVVRTYLKDKNQILKETKRKGLDRILEEHFVQIRKLNLDIKELYTISDQLSRIAVQSITKVGMIRYNPFGDVGGDQSFSIAFLNNNNDGFVISSLHGRERTRVYSKPIEEGKSKYHLSGEEEEVIKKAQA